MSLGILGASLLGKLLAVKGVIRAGDGTATKKKGKGIVRTDRCRFLSAAALNEMDI